VSNVIPNGALLPPGLAPASAPVRPAAPGTAQGATGAAPVQPGPTFAEVLATQSVGLEPPKFSRHALDRLERRGIEIQPQTLQRLSSGIAQAAAKGSRDSVVFVDGTAFVTSVKNNTVITAVGSEHMREHVFTNIDSAVIA